MPPPEEPGDLARLTETWSRLGESDPLWAVLSDPQMRGGGWEDHLEEFLASGDAEVGELSRLLATRGLRASAPVLEFGCGVGRVTRALAREFGETHGIDISEAMLARARARGDHDCHYHLNTAPDLRSFADGAYGLVYSRLVFQHMPRALGETFLAELLRLAAPGAPVVVQIPARRSGAARLRDPIAGVLGRAGVRAPGDGGIEMHSIPRRRVEAIAARAGAEVLSAERDASAGPSWQSWIYAIRAGGLGGSSE